MSKKLLAILFTSLFMVMLTAPSLALMDSRFEMISMIDFNDEEKKEGKEGKEGKKDIEWKVWQPNANTSQLSYLFEITQGDFYSNTYKLELEIHIFNPPELHF